MSIVAVGTDIVEIERFCQGRISDRLVQAVFTDEERTYCAANARPEQHYAARFAAKEAAVKALHAVTEFVSVCQVEVVRGVNGAPKVRLIPGRHGEPAPILGALVLHVSMSHAGHYASATAILESPG